MKHQLIITLSLLTTPLAAAEGPAEIKNVQHIKSHADTENPYDEELAPLPAPIISTKSKGRLTLQDAIALLLANHSQIEIVELNVDQAQGAVRSSKGAFDPQLGVSQDYEYQGGLSKTKLDGNAESTAVSISQQTRAGTSLSVSGSVSRNFNPVSGQGGGIYRSSAVSLSFRVTQPLLQGFLYGQSTMQEIATRYAYLSSYYGSMYEISSRLQQLISAYWSFAASKKLVEIQKNSLKRSEELLQSTRKLIAEEELPRSDIIQVKSQLLQEQFTLQRLEQTMLEALQELNFLIGLDLDPDDTTFLSYELDEFPKNQIEWTKLLGKLPKLLNYTLDERYDILAQENAYKGQCYTTKGIRNAVLPNLDLYFQADHSNSQQGHKTTTFAKRFNQHRSQKNRTVGVEFSMPFWNLGAEGAYDSAIAALKATKLGVDRLKQQTVTDVRSIFTRQINLERQLKLDERSIKENTQLVETEEKKLKSGFSTLFFVISYQNTLTSSKITYINDLLAYLNNLTQLQFQTGTLLSPVSSIGNYQVITNEDTWIKTINP